MEKIYALRLIRSKKFIIDPSGRVVWYPHRSLIEIQKEIWEGSYFYEDDDAVEIVELECN